MPLVSVCIPAYNHEKYITGCLKSVMAQTYKNLELLIIDDGSMDGTKQKIIDLMPQLKKRFVRVVFKSQKNQGTCKTINTLYKSVKRRYIYHIASDDMSKPDAILKQVKFLENNPDYALVVGDNQIIDSDGKVCYWDECCNNVYDLKKSVYKSFGDFLQKSRPDVDFNLDSFGKYITLLKGNYVSNGYLIRRSILKKIGGFTPDAPLEDWWFMLQISKYAKLKYIDEILFSYRWHGANTVKNITRMEMMANKTFEYELALLRKSDLLKTQPAIRIFFRKAKWKIFRHKYIYHKTKDGEYIKYRLFGFINICVSYKH